MHCIAAPGLVIGGIIFVHLSESPLSYVAALYVRKDFRWAVTSTTINFCSFLTCSVWQRDQFSTSSVVIKAAHFSNRIRCHSFLYHEHLTSQVMNFCWSKHIAPFYLCSDAKMWPRNPARIVLIYLFEIWQCWHVHRDWPNTESPYSCWTMLSESVRYQWWP